MNKQSLMLLLAAVVGLGVIADSGVGQSDEPLDFSRYEGVTRPMQQVRLSAATDGIVDAVLIKEGAIVTVGQPLIQMDDEVQRLAAESAKLQAESTAQIERAEYAVKETEILVDRIQQSFERDAASEWEVRRTSLNRDQAKADHKLAMDNQKLAIKRYELELARLERYRIDAPFDGVVLRRLVEPGATVQREDELLIVASRSPIRADIHLPARVYGALKVGGQYRLIGSTPAPEELIGELTVVDAMIDPASQTFRCMFEINNPDGAIPAGFVVRLGSLDPIE
ncbi:MAG: efflux RND transporter periplasmic adaptor subunit [Phycisphaeraceae bacterium]